MSKIDVVDLKKQKIEELKKNLEKDFGKGTFMGASEKPKFHEYISTGSLGLDKALGIGGLPKGRIVEIYGPESSGKTSLAIHVIAEAHKADKDSHCAFIDAEHAFDTSYAEAIGVDLKRLEISQPDYGEQALEVAERVCESGLYDVVVVDSVAALVPKIETEKEMGESSMGKQAMLMSQAMRKLTPKVAKSKTLLIFINQIREKIGIIFGSPETTTGGNALKFYATVRLDIRRSISATNSVMDGDIKIGNSTKVKVVKNKTAPPFRECEFNIIYGKGIDSYGELLDMAVDTQILVKSGSYYSYEGKVIGQGKDKAIATLREGKLFEQLKEKVVSNYTPKEFVPKDE